MKSLVNNIILVIFVGLVSTQVVAKDFILKTGIAESRGFLDAIKRLAGDQKWMLFDKQGFHSKSLDVTFAAGVIRGEKTPGHSDCFIYISKRDGKGQILLLSTKAEMAWYCVGRPALNVEAINGNLIIYSMFQYESPSGDLFNLPFVAQSNREDGFIIGALDSCIERKLEHVELKRLTQLYKPSQQCLSY